MTVSPDSLRDYLVDRGWLQATMGPSIKLTPPESLSLAKDFFVVIPTSNEAGGADKVISSLLATVAELYELSIDSLSRSISTGAEVFSMHLQGPAFADGSMPFNGFETLVERAKGALLNTAAFVLSETHTIESVPSEAKEYLERCRFLQTEHGSFVARIGLPATGALVQPTLLDSTPLTTSDVNARFTDILRFVVHNVLPANAKPTEEAAFEAALDLVNIDVLKNMKELMAKSGAEAIDFGFTSSKAQERLSTGSLSRAKLSRLDDFISYASNRLAADEELDMVGRIVELRSLRPDRRRNHVLVSGTVGEKQVFVGVSMGSRDYPTATTVHHRNGLVRVKGLARQLKTQLRVTKLLIFEDASSSEAPEPTPPSA